jgi:hypothetical protein
MINDINDIGDSMDKLIHTFGFLRRGCWIERRSGGYFWAREWFPNLEALDMAISKRHEKLDESINRIK